MEDAIRISNELKHETAAIWYISDDVGSKVMVKVPSPSIKAIIKGCKVEFLFGKDTYQKPNFFHIGIRIYDDSINYQEIICTQRFLFEHLSIAKIMYLDNVQIQFYNELNTCQAFGELTFEELGKQSVQSLLGTPESLYVGAFNDEVSKSLDNFQFSLGHDFKDISEVKRLNMLVINSRISDISVIKNFIYTDNHHVELLIDDKDEGNTLEDEVFIAMTSLFGKDTYKGARIPHKNTTRELTDILTFSEYGIFLIEAKALGVINLETERTMERKTLGLQKQVNKAIKQLVGASKSIAEEVSVYDRLGEEIFFNKRLVPHGVILVSELLPFGDWKEIVIALQKAMIEGNMMIHIFDMKEFIRFIGYSKGNKDQFDFLLMQRINNFVERQSVFLFSRFVDKSNEQEEIL